MKDATILESWSDVEAALRLVTLEGWMDRCWRWHLAFCQVASGPDGWLVSAEYQRPDRDSGFPTTGRGRPFWVPKGANAREVWGTAFAAVKLVLEHELLEAFHVAGRRVFDPHGPMLGAREQRA